jgi:hypothetical protein
LAAGSFPLDLLAVQYFCDGACHCNTAALNASGMASFSADLAAVSSQMDGEACSCPVFPVPECVLGKCVACPEGESCFPNTSGDGGADADAAAMCAQAAAAVCNAPGGCADGGAGEMSLLSCEVGMVWVSAAACIAELAANCGAGAAATSMNPSIADPGACMREVPFVCARGQADIPADCVTCVVRNADAG